MKDYESKKKKETVETRCTLVDRQLQSFLLLTVLTMLIMLEPAAMSVYHYRQMFGLRLKEIREKLYIISAELTV